MSKDPKQITDISQFRTDIKNANKGTQRGLAMVESSMRELGAGRSIVVDKHGRVIAGNKTITVAADIGLEIQVVHTTGDRLVVVQRDDLDLSDDTGPARKLAYLDNQASSVGLSWDAEQLLADMTAGVDLSNIFNQDELDAMLAGLVAPELAEEKREITRGGRLYNAGEGHSIEPFKLAYRIEAIWQSQPHLAIDLYSGQGQLAAWYKRRFARVVTVDNAYAQGDVDYSMSAVDFIASYINEYMDFDFIDFDDEGSPAIEIKTLFDAIKGRKKNSFILALTDGNGMNFKFHGLYDFGNYLMNEGKRRATREDYDRFDLIVSEFITKIALDSGFNATALSAYRGRENNVVFQTWLIDPV